MTVVGQLCKNDLLGTGTEFSYSLCISNTTRSFFAYEVVLLAHDATVNSGLVFCKLFSNYTQPYIFFIINDKTIQDNAIKRFKSTMKES